MSFATKIDPKEFRLMRDYIEKNCGIYLSDEKMYLVETRLTTLMVESGCNSFTELHKKASEDRSQALRDKIIDAMTTNETLWFRDTSPFNILQEVLLEEMCQELKQGKRGKIRIWSAACSTGQEPYSIAMIIDEYIRRHPGISPNQFEILGTDISPTVLFLAKIGRYDHLSISRGLPENYKRQYFTPQGKIWALKDNIKSMITFRKLNLQDSFSLLGKHDIIFCRNVLIYFSDTFKKDILSRMAALLRPDGYLFLGASESIINYTREYDMLRHNKGLYYTVKKEALLRQ